MASNTLKIILPIRKNKYFPDKKESNLHNWLRIELNCPNTFAGIYILGFERRKNYSKIRKLNENSAFKRGFRMI